MSRMTPDLRLRTALLALTALCVARPLASQLPAPPVSASVPFHVGGYGSLTYRRPVRSDSVARAGIEEAAAALLVSGTLGRLSYFGELQGASVSRQNFSGREDSRTLDLPRAYAEYAFADAFRIRAGRFLTPVGQWNEAHAGPLTETAGRPLTTFRPFPKAMLGVMAAGQAGLGSHDAGYAVWASPFDLEPHGEGEDNTFVRGIGARLAMELLPDLYVGASGAAFRELRHRGDDEPDGDGDDGVAGERVRIAGIARSDRADVDDLEEDPSTRGMGGVDVMWRFHGAQFLSEAVYLARADSFPAERGAFAEAAVPLVARVRATARYEVYDPVVTSPLRIWTAGANWRPDRFLTVKVERQATSRRSRRAVDGWLVSLALLF